jgi:hypothetical protein
MHENMRIAMAIGICSLIMFYLLTMMKRWGRVYIRGMPLVQLSFRMGEPELTGD